MADDPGEQASPTARAQTFDVDSPTAGRVVQMAPVGALVEAGAEVAVVEVMKMEHAVTTAAGGRVKEICAAAGDVVEAGQRLLVVVTERLPDAPDTGAPGVGSAIRGDLEETRRRHARLMDSARPNEVGRRHADGHRTVRENIADLVDEGTFHEYGGLAVAGQRQRHSLQSLIERTPADGVVTGTGSVNGLCVIVGYDYTVWAGTQGHQGHRKVTRMLELAHRRRLPVVIFGEGGGGRAGETDGLNAFGLDIPTWRQLGLLSGVVPLVGVVAGYSFAGNAAMLGGCDVIIATQDSSLGMGGPAMIEGGGLGTFTPDEVGPMAVQGPNGVVDLVVEDDRAAVAAARRYLSYFQGRAETYGSADQTLLRDAVPENRARSYDMRAVVDLLTDTASVLELRKDFGPSIITALGRVEGWPLGIVASNPMALGGAIDSAAADKMTRFVRVCETFDLPVLSLCDTPGILVGPEAEKEATVRHAARLFVATASLRVPLLCVVLRKAYGLGAQAMFGGSVHAPFFTVAWPTAQFGSMGVEGMVRLGFRRELDQLEDEDERRRFFDEQARSIYEKGSALTAATYFELDDVIDPADTRSWIATALHNPRATPGPASRPIDPW